MDKDGLISRDELKAFIARNEKLYVMLSVNLGLPEEKCREIATEVAYQMSKRAEHDSSLRDLTDSARVRKPTLEEFQDFLNWLEEPKGQQEFFQRTVFATFDLDQSGYIEPDELDNFLDVFYQAGSIFAGDVRLPKKAKLRTQVMKQLDVNKDGKLEFSELRTLISGGARAGLTFTEADYVDSDEERAKEEREKERQRLAEAAKMKTKRKSSRGSGSRGKSKATERNESKAPSSSSADRTERRKKSSSDPSKSSSDPSRKKTSSSDSERRRSGGKGRRRKPKEENRAATAES